MRSCPANFPPAGTTTAAVRVFPFAVVQRAKRCPLRENNSAPTGSGFVDTLTGSGGGDIMPCWGMGHELDNTDANRRIGAMLGGVLDLRDLLVGENAGNLSNYLHFTTSGGNTTIAVSSTGAFSSGFSAGAVDQVIQINGVNLVGGFGSDAQVIADLLNRGKLVTDASP